MAGLTHTDIASVIKTVYAGGKVPLEVMYKGSPEMALFPKNTEWAGDGTLFPLMWGNPQGRSAVIGTAITNKSASKWAGFKVTAVNDYAVWSVDGRVIAETRKDSGSFVRHLKAEMDGSMRQLKRSLTHALPRNGGGALGRLAAASAGGASATITLANKYDSVFFEVGQVLKGSATDGTSGSVRAGSATISAIDRAAGTLTTAGGNWATQITGLTESDYLFVEGDFGVKLVGLDAWIPASAPGATAFYGVTRSADPTRLGGVRLASTSSSRPIDENAIDLLDAVTSEGGEPDVIFVHNRQFSNLEKRLSTRVQYGERSVDAGGVKLGFKTIQINGPKGVVDVVGSNTIQLDTMWALQLDTWQLGSMGELFQMLDDDGLPYLRMVDTDAIEGRLVSRPGLACLAPGFNGRCTLGTTGL